MGIPYYFNYLITKYKSIFNTHPKHTQYLYIDFNSVIHNVANVSNTNSHTDIIQNIIKEVQNIVENIIIPSNLLFIAVDGMCPIAKMIQQRKRRYLNTWNKTVSQNEWNSNIVTPGTDFMKELDAALNRFASENKYPFKTIISTSQEYGEGEHKIFQHLNTLCGKNCVIMGMDADLIMLSLLHKDNNILLSRDATTCINIENLRQSIEIEFEIDVLSYIVLCFFMGNDFLPPLSYFSIRNKGIDTIIKYFKQINTPIICHKSSTPTINLQAIYLLLQKLAISETENITYGISKNLKQNIIEKSTVDLNNYYEKLFNGTDIKSYCQTYIQGILWIFHYYTNYQTASKTWFYPYSYSPLINDIVTHFEFEPSNVGIQESFLSLPYIQLLIVLPPSCSFMIPCSKIRSIMTDESKGLTHLFPYDFKIETFLKSKLWECSPKLPFLSLAEIEYYFRLCI